MELTLNDEKAGTLKVNLTSGKKLSLDVAPWTRAMQKRLAALEKEREKISDADGIRDNINSSVRILAPGAKAADLEKIPFHLMPRLMQSLIEIAAGADQLENEEEKKTPNRRQRRTSRSRKRASASPKSID